MSYASVLESFMPVNAFILLIAVQQFGAGIYSMYLTNPKVGAILMLVAMANGVMAYVEQ